MIDYAKLRELLAKATPGPWAYMGLNNTFEGEIRCAADDYGSHFKHIATIGDPVNDNEEDMQLIVALHEAAPELIAAAEQAQGECEWTVDDDAIWHTDCGHSFCFIDDGPTENKVRFCCYCGRKLVEVKP